MDDWGFMALSALYVILSQAAKLPTKENERSGWTTPLNIDPEQGTTGSQLHGANHLTMSATQ